MYTMTKAKTHQHVHVILRLEQYNALQAESQRTGAPMTELIRRAVDAALTSKRRGK